MVPIIGLALIVLGLGGCPTPQGSLTLTVVAAAGGTTVPSGAVTVKAGVATSISATGSVGHNFVSWTVTSGTASIANPNTGSTTVTLSAGNATVQANFT